MNRKIASDTSRTAEMNCLTRAVSYRETNPLYKSGDSVAPLLIPNKLRPFTRFSPLRRLYRRLCPKGMYEYVVARTRTIDSVVEREAPLARQVLVFGAGFDTRSVRFGARFPDARFFELDSPVTQRAKIDRLKQAGVALPENTAFIAIDFDQDSLSEKLDAAGFLQGVRSLFILEGLTMYLKPESADALFQLISDYAGPGSVVVFDAVLASVVRGEGAIPGQQAVVRRVTNAGEDWLFGIEAGGSREFVERFGLKLTDEADASALEARYFGGETGLVNGTHVLIQAEK
jgi:methyltransferase (TIGR00027 family)